MSERFLSRFFRNFFFVLGPRLWLWLCHLQQYLSDFFLVSSVIFSFVLGPRLWLWLRRLLVLKDADGRLLTGVVGNLLPIHRHFPNPIKTRLRRKTCLRHQIHL